jgi:hypothetical protein
VPVPVSTSNSVATVVSSVLKVVFAEGADCPHETPHETPHEPPQASAIYGPHGLRVVPAPFTVMLFTFVTFALTTLVTDPTAPVTLPALVIVPAVILVVFAIVPLGKVADRNPVGFHQKSLCRLPPALTRALQFPRSLYPSEPMKPLCRPNSRSPPSRSEPPLLGNREGGRRHRRRCRCRLEVNYGHL